MLVAKGMCVRTRLGCAEADYGGVCESRESAL